ncbi:CD177 antigen [Cavia porcellus]|uniref:CD177 antigen n=1 Tax=Cavia porcellus TaxID=10141 RepID=UPI002FE0FCDB
MHFLGREPIGDFCHHLNMSPAPLLAFLGVTFLLPDVQTLYCQWGTVEVVKNVSELPYEWTNSQTTCETGEGCRETAILIKNGPQVTLLLSKGCTMEKDQEATVTEHRAGPGLSIISYTRVCRHGFFCNDLSTTDRLSGLPTATVPGTLRCPVCFSKGDCPENPPQQICPKGHTHCYNGVLEVRGGGIATNLRVQGCMPQPGCNLLNGTQVIGPIHLSENCGPKSGNLVCKKGTLETLRDVSTFPVEWTTPWQSCEIGEGCQETVVLIVNGDQVNLVLSKGCTEAKDQEPRVTWHRAGPGLTVVSYTRVCRHGDFCNDVSNTRTFWTPPASPDARGSLRCAHCLSKDDCPENSSQQTCPAGHTHCYKGVLKLRGGGIFSNLRVQGCMPQPGCNLLNGTQVIGPIHVSEDCGPKSANLDCKKGAAEAIRDVSTFPLEWTTSWQSCEIGEGCQETVVLIVNGDQVNLVLSKGCTEAKDQEPRVTWHRAGPGLTVVSYTRVCRHGDFCNDVSNTRTFWTPPASPDARVPGTLLCPHCLSSNDCPENPPQQICPAGYSHCYNGMVRLRGGGIFSNLRVQGCMPQPGCNLLNGTQVIGPMDVSENCGPKSDTVVCHRGVMLQMGRRLHQEPVEWEASGQQDCSPGEVCQETLLLIEPAPGQQSLLVGSKGCSSPERQDGPAVSIHSNFPGILVASYVRFCSSNMCNSASSSSVLLGSILRPVPPPPGHLQCPVCVQFSGACSDDSNIITCPSGTTHCYKGSIDTRGGGLSATFSIQGCMPESSRSLLNKARKIGIFSVHESYEEENSKEKNKKTKVPRKHSGASAPYLAWVVGLGPFVALWCGGFLLPVKSIFP